VWQATLRRELVKEMVARAIELGLSLLVTSHLFMNDTSRPAIYYMQRLGMSRDDITSILSKMDSSGTVNLSIAKSLSDAPVSVRALQHRLPPEVRSHPRGMTGASVTRPTVSMGESPLRLAVDLQRLLEDRWLQRIDTTWPCCVSALSPSVFT